MNRTSHPSRRSSHRFGMAFSMTIALIVTVALEAAQSAHAFTCPFDDGNSSLEIEGLILTRYALGVTGAPMVASTPINAVDAPAVEATINCPSCGLNITGNATMTVADATIISRKLAGFSGGALTDGLALGVGTRNTPALVQSFLLAGCGVTGGTVTSITAGTGLTGGSITTSGTLAVDPSYVQRRLSSGCSAGSFITAVAADGTVTCVAAPTGTGGTVTSVTASAPLASSGGAAPNLSLTGLVTLNNGGTGGNLSGTGGAGQVLKQSLPGSTISVGALAASDVPDLGASYIRNGTVQQAASGFNISGNGFVGGKVNIGVSLNVGGVIETTSGGVRFPDGTTQTTAASGPAFQWQVVAGTAQQALPNMGYVLANAGQVTLALPTAPNVGDTVRVSGVGAGGWRLAQNAGQSVNTVNLGPSASAGQIWTPRDSNRDWRAVASSADGSKLVAAANGGQLYTSTDSGVSWTPRESARNWFAVASSADGSKLVAAPIGDPLYTSTDSGGTWTPRDSSRVWLSVASSADGSKLVAVANGGRIYTSTDFGASWTPRESSRDWRSVASSADGSKLVAGGDVGLLYTSTDSGVSWSPRANASEWVAVASSADGSRLVAATQAGPLYTSTDSGLSWTPREIDRDWRAVASSADGSRLVAGANLGQLYTSTDSGVTWAPRESSRGWSAVASSADASKLVAVVSTGQIYTSAASTVLGTAGYLSGVQSSAIELQYIGNGQFVPLSYVGSITNN